jgi:hypothetical protein
MAEQPRNGKHAGGRPRLTLDLRQVEELARIACTEEDMAAVLGVSVDTIQRRKRTSAEFRGVIEKGRASLRNSLRRLQVKKALEGNTTMLIWLGKQLLGQSDRQSAELTGAEGKPLMPPAVIYLPRGEGGRPAELGSDALARKLVPELYDTSDAPRR